MGTLLTKNNHYPKFDTDKYNSLNKAIIDENEIKSSNEWFKCLNVEHDEITSPASCWKTNNLYLNDKISFGLFHELWKSENICRNEKFIICDKHEAKWYILSLEKRRDSDLFFNALFNKLY